jgi:hypothetical protein
MYLFDTDIITNIFKKQPSPRLLRRLFELPQSRQHISTVTVSEIVYGAGKSNPRNFTWPTSRIFCYRRSMFSVSTAKPPTCADGSGRNWKRSERRRPWPIWKWPPLPWPMTLSW